MYKPSPRREVPLYSLCLILHVTSWIPNPSETSPLLLSLRVPCSKQALLKDSLPNSSNFGSWHNISLRTVTGAPRFWSLSHKRQPPGAFGSCSPWGWSSPASRSVFYLSRCAMQVWFFSSAFLALKKLGSLHHTLLKGRGCVWIVYGYIFNINCSVCHIVGTQESFLK